MSTAKERINVFEDTMKWVKTDADLAASIVEAKKNTEIFWENDYPAFNCDEETFTGITISRDRALKLR